MNKERMDILPDVRKYRHSMERRMADHMRSDENARNTSSFKDMHESWEKAREMEKELNKCIMSPGEITKWVDGMKNADGTTGSHWTKDQTTAAAKMAGVLMGYISPEVFWATMNMMYSDFGPVADKFNANKPEFFAELAKSFLFDKDGPDPEDKITAYYRGVVCYEE